MLDSTGQIRNTRALVQYSPKPESRLFIARPVYFKGEGVIPQALRDQTVN
jgi:hypothetical protein